MCSGAKRLCSEVSSQFAQELDRVLYKTEDPLAYMNVLLKRCSLCRNRGKSLPVSSFGKTSSRTLILDSNPGVYQRESGNTLNWDTSTIKFLSKVFIKTTVQDCYMSYCFRCSTDNRDYLSYDKCSLWLSYELRHLSNLDTIVTLGEDAFHCIMGDTYPSLKDIYGNVYNIELFGRSIRVIPLMHPWFLMKSSNFKDKTIEIIRRNNL